MSDGHQGIEVITGTARWQRWLMEQKLEVIEEMLHSGENISAIARRRGVAPNLLYRWRRLMTDDGAVAV